MPPSARRAWWHGTWSTSVAGCRGPLATRGMGRLGHRGRDGPWHHGNEVPGSPGCHGTEVHGRVGDPVTCPAMDPGWRGRQEPRELGTCRGRGPRDRGANLLRGPWKPGIMGPRWTGRWVSRERGTWESIRRGTEGPGSVGIELSWHRGEWVPSCLGSEVAGDRGGLVPRDRLIEGPRPADKRKGP